MLRSQQMIDLVAELLALSDALERCGVRFAICGGLAVAIHGHVRATKDIDLLVHEADLERVLASAADLGFDLRAQPMTFGAGTEVERRVQRGRSSPGSRGRRGIGAGSNR